MPIAMVWGLIILCWVLIFAVVYLNHLLTKTTKELYKERERTRDVKLVLSTVYQQGEFSNGVTSPDGKDEGDTKIYEIVWEALLR